MQCSHYSGLSLSGNRKGPTNLFEKKFEITVKIEIFTKKADWVNKVLSRL